MAFKASLFNKLLLEKIKFMHFSLLTKLHCTALNCNVLDETALLSSVCTDSTPLICGKLERVRKAIAVDGFFVAWERGGAQFFDNRLVRVRVRCAQVEEEEEARKAINSSL